jgi:mannose-6-phosphate isomerase-like protein (cupin superfamily)
VRSYTINHLRDVQDLGPALGVETAQEVRFPQMDAETTGLSLMRVKPGQRQAVAHHHTQAEEIYVIVTGAGRIKLNDDIRDVKPLDAIRIAPSVVRAVEAGPDGIEYLAFGPRHADDGETSPVDEFWAK